ncbi:EpsG family protein [Enterobacter cloacae]|uniref:EpsG family protein n=1 Tax=Enterobacter cloacae TaxID=550 RepID=UPI001BAA88D6|nr:EpsG family protein [Enterobacter cloacae]QUG51755.1 EpsG family protein [Enterobacter cloacae]
MYWIIFLTFQFICVLLSWQLPFLKKIIFTLMIFILMFFMIDGYFNGIDWVNYYYGFITYTDVMDYLSSYEPLFGSEIFILKYLFTDFYLSIAMYYFILSVLLYFAIIKLRGLFDFNICLFVFLLIVINGIDLFNDQIRQAMAFAISIFAFLKLLKNEKTRFIIIAFLAVCFHFSAIVVLLFYPLVTKNKKSVIFFGGCAAFCIVILSLSNELFSNVISLFGAPGAVISAKIKVYFSKFEPTFGLLAIVNLLIIFRYFVATKYETEIERILWNGSFIASLLHLSFYFFPILHRLNPYFNLFYCLLSAYYLRSLIRLLTINRIVNYLSILLIIASVNISYFNDPARPENYRGYTLDYLLGYYDIDKDKIKRCNSFITDVPFCRW